MPVAIKEGIAVQTMKPMGRKFLLESRVITPSECLRYALSQPASVVIHGMESMEQLNHALDVVKTFVPLTNEEISAMAAKARQAAMTGKYELFQNDVTLRRHRKEPVLVGIKERSPI